MRIVLDILRLRVISVITAVIGSFAGLATNYAKTDGRVFHNIDTKDGLSDNRVLHIMQLPDGRMAINTHSNINLYDGKIFDYVHYSSDTKHPIPAYCGYSHTYASADNRIWSKSTGYVQCFDLKTNQYISNIDSVLNVSGADKSPDDLYVDQEGTLWTVTESGVLDTKHGRRIPLAAGHLQDLETKGDTLMLFYDTGIMEGFYRSSGKQLWRSAAYENPTSYTATSLVRLTPDGKILQVRSNAAGHAILLYFDPEVLVWSTLLKTPYMLHTLAVASDSVAYIASRKGLWHINIKNRLAELQNYLNGRNALTSLSKGFNTIFIDKEGGVWIGTYRDGILYSPGSGSRILSRGSLKELGIDSLRLTRTFLDSSRSLVDKSNHQWKASDDGLHMRNLLTGFDTILYKEDGLSNNCIKSLAVAPDSILWVTTAHGINSVAIDKEGKISVIAHGEAIPSTIGEYTDNEAFLSERGWPVFSNSSGWTAILPPAKKDSQIAFRINEPTPSPSRRGILPIIGVVAALGLAIPVAVRIRRKAGKTDKSSAESRTTSANDQPPSINDQPPSANQPLTSESNQPVLISRHNQADSSQASDSLIYEEHNQEIIIPGNRDFIEKATTLVMANLKSGYSVEKLSSDLCMERTGLYKRMNAILGISPSAFIRKVRIARAIQLIEEGTLSINEIAEETGFSSSSHMSRCFKEDRGCTPTAYARVHP